MCCCCHWIRELRGKYVRFSKAAVFISALFFGIAFVDNAFTAFMIMYIQYILKMPSLWKAAVLINIFQGVTMFLSAIFDFEVVNRIGTFMVLISTIPALIIGLLLLWLTEWLLTLNISIRVFHPGILLLAIGIAGSSSASGFLCHQFIQEPKSERGERADDPFSREENSNVDTEETDNEFSQKKRLEEYVKINETRANIWRYAFLSLGSVIASTFTSGLTWRQTLKVSSIVMVVAYLIFCIGTSFYNRIKPTRKALVSQLKEAWPLWRLLPHWAVFIVYSVADAAGLTFFIAQGDGLDDSIDIRIPVHNFNRIPLTSFYLLQTFTSFIISLLSDFLIEKWFSATESIKQRATTLRIGIGMLFACASYMMAWWVEVCRLKFIDEGITGKLPMKVLWLAPQFFFLGIVNGLVGKGKRPFFYDRVPIQMWHFEFPFNESVLGIGRLFAAFSVFLARNWIGDFLDESHLDNYLLVLAIINLCTVPYIFLSYKYDCKIEAVETESHAIVDGVEIPRINFASEGVLSSSTTASRSTIEAVDRESNGDGVEISETNSMSRGVVSSSTTASGLTTEAVETESHAVRDGVEILGINSMSEGVVKSSTIPSRSKIEASETESHTDGDEISEINFTSGVVVSSSTIASSSTTEAVKIESQADRVEISRINSASRGVVSSSTIASKSTTKQSKQNFMLLGMELKSQG